MKFLLPLVACVAAAPLEQRQQQTFAPTKLSRYNVGTGAVQANVNTGLVERYPSNRGQDLTTLISFEIPIAVSSRQCRLSFGLGTGDGLQGETSIQVFTSLAPAGASRDTWPNGNLRNQFLGSLRLSPNQQASWIGGSGPFATSNGVFPCSDVAGKLVGYELAPVGDFTRISWAASNGLRITAL